MPHTNHMLMYTHVFCIPHPTRPLRYYDPTPKKDQELSKTPQVKQTDALCLLLTVNKDQDLSKTPLRVTAVVE